MVGFIVPPSQPLPIHIARLVEGRGRLHRPALILYATHTDALPRANLALSIYVALLYLAPTHPIHAQHRWLALARLLPHYLPNQHDLANSHCLN